MTCDELEQMYSCDIVSMGAVKKYRIYLPKSRETASSIADDYREEMLADSPEKTESRFIERITWGACSDIVPRFYREQGYSMCCVTFDENAPVLRREVIFW